MPRDGTPPRGSRTGIAFFLGEGALPGLALAGEAAGRPLQADEVGSQGGRGMPYGPTSEQRLTPSQGALSDSQLPSARGATLLASPNHFQVATVPVILSRCVHALIDKSRSLSLDGLG